MKTPSKGKVLILEGNPRERGQIHGEMLKPLILEGIERWKFRLHAHYQINPDQLIDQFIKKTNFIPTINQWAPHLLEEVKGIGEGASVDFKTIFIWQCMDEQWWHLKSYTRHAVEHCSVLGCFREGNNSTLLAQNMDLPNIYEGLEVLLHIKHSDSPMESFVYTFAGMIALCGLNNQPLGICTNTLLSLNSSIDGYPAAFIVRSVLEQPNLNKAVELIHKIKHASGQNYTVGNAERIVSLECSANKVCQYIPHESRVYHTNHPLVNDDLITSTKKSTVVNTSQPRFNYLESQLKDSTKTITMETVKKILRSHETNICRHSTNKPKGGLTFGSLIYVLTNPPELYLAMGPPCSKEYKKYRFNCNSPFKTT